MARFDFVECTSKAYRYAWEHGRELVRPSLLVLFAKFLCFVFIIAIGLESNPLRQGLVLLPAYFIEGWVIARVIFHAFRREGDPAYAIPLSGDFDIKRAILVSTVIYVLTKLLLSFLIGFPLTFNQGIFPQEPSASEEMNTGMFIPAVALAVFMIWAFRFFWLYIPPVLGLRIEDFLTRIRPLYSSFYMLGLWVLCVVPLGLLLVIVSKAIGSVLFAAPLAETYLVAFVQGGFDYVTILISSLGMAYGISSIFNDEDKTVSLF